MSGNQEAFHKAINLGHSAAWDQMWDRAASFYRQALEEFPDNPSALANLGLALYEMKDYDNALRIYGRAARVSSQDPAPFEKIGKISERMGRISEAVQAYIQAADLFLKTRDVEKSIENWIQVLRLQESLIARTRLAMIYDRIGRKADAVAEFMAAASLMQHAGDPAKALQAAEYALQLIPENIDTQQAVIMIRNGQPLPRPNRPRGGTGPTRMAEVRQLELAGPELAGPDPISEARQKALVELAGLLFDQAEDTGVEDNQSSRHGLNSLTRGTGGASQAQAERTRIQLHLGQAIDSQTKGEDAQAAEELERTIEAGLRHPAALYALGLLVHKKDPQKGLRYLQDSVKHPDFALASYLLIGKIRYDAGLFLEAAVANLQALRMADAETVELKYADELRQLYEPIIETQTEQSDPEELKSLCESVHNQLVRNDWRIYMKMARQQLPLQTPGSPPLPLAEMLLESNSAQVVEMLAHVRNLTKEGKLNSAMEEAFHALQYAPTYLPLHIQIAELLVRDGRIQDAVDKLLIVANLYTIRGESAQAIRLFNRIVEMAPMDLNVRNRMIDLLLAQGKTESAVQQYINLAEIYYQLAEMDMARQTYTTGLRVAQQSRGNRAMLVQIMYKIADIDMQRLDLRNALRIYEQIRTLEPEDLQSRARLVDINFRMSQPAAAMNEMDGFLALLENNNNHTTAIEFLQAVLADQPDRIDVRKRLAEVYRHAGKMEEAVRQWESVSNQLMNRGDHKGAIAALQSILSLKPPDADQYQKRLAQLQRFV
jgi:tetratricopeptide (TPR) repeat protein